MRFSFRTQTALAILLISLMVTAGLAYLAVAWSEQVESAFLKKQEQIILRQVRMLTTPALSRGDAEDLKRVIGLVGADPAVAFIRVYDVQGELLAQSGKGPASVDLGSGPALLNEADGKVYADRVELTVEGQPVALVDLGLSATASAGLLDEMRMMGVGLLIPVLGVMTVFAYLFGSLLTERLRALMLTADRIAEKGPGITVQVRGNDEIARVSRSLNDMSKSLSVTYRQLQESAREQRELSVRLQEKEKQQRTMLEMALDAVVTVDPEGFVVDFNRTAEEIFGYTREETLGQDMSNLIIPRHFRAAHQQGMKHLRETGEGPVLGQRLEIEGMHKSGRVFPIELAIVDVDMEGKHLYTGFIRDITDRKQAEAELRLAARAFETREGIFITDSESNIIRVNRAFEQLTGYRREEATRLTPASLIARRSFEGATTTSWKDLLARGRGSAETMICRKDGTSFPVWLGLTPVSDAEGTLTHFVAHFFDMTDRFRFEQELKDAQLQAEAASQAKSRFLANMSHEIRTPLNAIINLNEMLLETELSQEQRKLAITARQGGKALNSLVNSVLDLTQIESGKLSISFHVFNLRKLIEELQALFTPQAFSAGLYLKVEIDDALPQWVEGDETRLRQVLLNLVGNALKFTEQGWVLLRVSQASSQADADDGGGLVRFQVDDTGIGITEKAAGRIFEEFTQADVSLARRFGGSGLGLTISQLLVRMMHGQIEYKPREDGGSSFSFEVPLPASEMEPHEAESSEGMATVSGRVLLAEDSQANQMVARAILEKAGCEVVIASDGREAIDIATREAFDLILMDLSMPKVDGLEAATTIRGRAGPNTTTPIVALTANVFEEDRQRCVKAGMNDFVGKPVEANMLRQKLQQWLAGDSEMEPPEAPGVSAGADLPLLDVAVLDNMERETSSDLVKEILGIFVEETRVRLVTLGACMNAALEEITSAAHAIKSSAGTFGARRLQEVARQVEVAARAGEDDSARKLIQSVLDVGSETLGSYMNHLSDNGGSLSDRSEESS
jgi:PAS domain S-box-containing protein